VPIPVFALAIAGWLGVIVFVLALGRVAARADTFARGRATTRTRPPLYKARPRVKSSPL
jgi:hypothetical protein